MTKKLIINSDDYGRTPDVSRGIRYCHLNGIVTSTTCMMNIPTTAADIAVALKETPKLGLGVHLVLTADAPILPPEKVKTLVDAQGNFLKQGKLIERINAVDPAEAKAEWHAQITAFVKAAGKKPTHLDSHHHSSYFSPALFRAMLELAQEFDCGIRLPVAVGESDVRGYPAGLTQSMLAEFKPRSTTAFFDDFYDEGATRDGLIALLNRMGEGSYEIMCHPGYTDGLAAITSYAAQRETELAVLTDPEVRAAIESRGINLISFAEL